MNLRCVWEHNGEDTLLHIENLPGAAARGQNLAAAEEKLPETARSWLAWAGRPVPEDFQWEIVQEHRSALTICDADTDVLFDAERLPLARQTYEEQKALALRSAEDFLTLYRSVPDPQKILLPPRTTFYGAVPSTAEGMYRHTKNVNEYYFGEIGVPADNEGDILSCRRRGFAALECRPDFLENRVFSGSDGELWSLAKILRRFLWHDRIHARAMRRAAAKTFGPESLPDPFHFTR